jgi:hypothetical protein
LTAKYDREVTRLNHEVSFDRSALLADASPQRHGDALKTRARRDVWDI